MRGGCFIRRKDGTVVVVLKMSLSSSPRVQRPFCFPRVNSWGYRGRCESSEKTCQGVERVEGVGANSAGQARCAAVSTRRKQPSSSERAARYSALFCRRVGSVARQRRPQHCAGDTPENIELRWCHLRRPEMTRALPSTLVSSRWSASPISIARIYGSHPAPCPPQRQAILSSSFAQ